MIREWLVNAFGKAMFDQVVPRSEVNRSMNRDRTNVVDVTVMTMLSKLAKHERLPDSAEAEVQEDAIDEYIEDTAVENHVVEVVLEVA